MSKPIDEAKIMTNACNSCRCHTKDIIPPSGTFLIIPAGQIFHHEFSCRLSKLGMFEEPCALEDWARCPLNKDIGDIQEKLSRLGGIDISNKFSDKKEWRFSDGSTVIFIPPSSKSATEKPGSTSYIEDLKKLEFESRNKFYWGCQHYFNKLKKDIDDYLETLPVKPDLDNPAERHQAWLEIIEEFVSTKVAGDGESI